MDTVPEWHKRNLVTLVDGPTIAGVLSVPRFLEVMDTWAQFITGSLDPRKGVVQEQATFGLASPLRLRFKTQAMLYGQITDYS